MVVVVCVAVQPLLAVHALLQVKQAGPLLLVLVLVLRVVVWRLLRA